MRPDPAAPGPKKMRVVFPVISVLSKPRKLPYGATYGGVYFVFLRQEAFRQPPRKHFVIHGKSMEIHGKSNGKSMEKFMDNPWIILGKSMNNPWIIKTEKRKRFRGTPWVHIAT